MNMKVVGGIAILIAAILVWLAISAAIESSGMRGRVDSINTGWTKMVNDATGATQVAEGRIAAVETMVVQFIIGAAIMGIVGAGFMIGKRRRKAAAEKRNYGS